MQGHYLESQLRISGAVLCGFQQGCYPLCAFAFLEVFPLFLTLRLFVLHVYVYGHACAWHVCAWQTWSEDSVQELVLCSHCVGPWG